MGLVGGSAFFCLQVTVSLSAFTRVWRTGELGSLSFVVVGFSINFTSIETTGLCKGQQNCDMLPPFLLLLGVALTSGQNAGVHFEELPFKANVEVGRIGVSIFFLISRIIYCTHQ